MGLPESDQATLVEFFTRHGDHITYTSIINDPVFLTEPSIKTTDFFRQPTDPGGWLFPCDDSEQVVGRAPDQVPNYLFGKQPFVEEHANKYKLPLLGILGGPETMYGEFEAKVKTATAAEARAKTLPAAGPSLTSRAVDPDPKNGEIHVLQVRGNVYMLVGDAGNVVVQTGDDGAFVVDTGGGQLTDKILAAIKQLSPKPIRMIANTSFLPAHTSGNEKLKNAGSDPSVLGTFLALAAPGAGSTASILSHENVVPRMNGSTGTPATPAGSWPIDTYIGDRLRKFHNGDSVELFHTPDAITDGDSFVHFRRADVIATGEVFTTTQYPFIDIANGGSVQGEINALNAILARTVFEHSGEGGTLIVPGRGYLCDEHEVVEYRDMVAIIRDRVKAMIAGGASLQQVKAARCYGGLRHTLWREHRRLDDDMFVEAVYNSLKKK
jgi:glyoxylase-like metal-dependent hydrolase (beta-lactamase superfamily II)